MEYIKNFLGTNYEGIVIHIPELNGLAKTLDKIADELKENNQNKGKHLYKEENDYE